MLLFLWAGLQRSTSWRRKHCREASGQDLLAHGQGLSWSDLVLTQLYNQYASLFVCSSAESRWSADDRWIQGRRQEGSVHTAGAVHQRRTETAAKTALKHSSTYLTAQKFYQHFALAFSHIISVILCCFNDDISAIFYMLLFVHSVDSAVVSLIWFAQLLDLCLWFLTMFSQIKLITKTDNSCKVRPEHDVSLVSVAKFNYLPFLLAVSVMQWLL